MATIANLLIHLGVDTRDVRKDTRSVAPDAEQAGVSAGEKFKSGFSRGLSGFASMVGSVVKTVATGAAAIGLAAGGIGLQTAAGMQQAQIGFSTLLKDGKQAEAFLGDLSNFAKSTPFEFPGVRDAARQLLGVGQSASSVIPTLTAFGNASGALGLNQEQFGRVMLATTQAMAKGKLQGEELMQMTEAGIPIWPLLSKALGKPVPELQKMAEQGKLLTKDVLPKLEAQMMKDYGGSMVAQSQTLTGQWSTLKDTISMGLGKAIMPLTPALGRAATAATDLADKGLGKLTAWMESTGGPALDKFVTKVENLFAGGGGGGMGATLNSIKDAVNGIDGKAAGADLSSIGDSLTKLKPVVSELVSSLPSFNDLIDVSATVLKFLADHSDTLAKALPYLVAAIIAYKIVQAGANVAAAAAIPLRLAEVIVNGKLVKANNALATATRAQTTATVAASTATKASTAATVAGDAANKRNVISTMASKVAAVAANVATKAWAAGQWILNAAMSANPLGLVLIAVVALVAGIILLWKKSETFREIVTAVWEAIKAAAVAVFDFLKGYFIAVFNGYKAAFEIAATAAKWVWDKIVAAWNGIKAATMAVFNAVKDYLVWVFNGYKAAFGIVVDAAKWVWDKVTDWFNRVVSFIGGLGSTIRSKASGMWDGIVSAARGAINQVISAWNRLDFGINIRVPDWVPGVGGKGFSIPDLFPDIPMLARGGVVPATPGGQLAVLAEAGHAEIAAPEPLMRQMITDAVAAGAGGGGGIHVENLNLRAYSDRFSLSQVQNELVMHGAH